MNKDQKLALRNLAIFAGVKIVTAVAIQLIVRAAVKRAASL